MSRKCYIIAYYIAVLSINDSIIEISCQYFDVWPYNSYQGYNADAQEAKSDDYVNPWLFDVSNNEPQKSVSNFAEAPAPVPQANVNFYAPQVASAGVNNNLYNPQFAPAPNHNNLHAPQQQPVHHTHNMHQQNQHHQMPHQGHNNQNHNMHQQNQHHQMPHQDHNNQNHNMGHQVQQQGQANHAALAHDAGLMEAVNNFDQKTGNNLFNYENTGHFYGVKEKDEAAPPPDGLNPWLSASHDNTPEWAKNRPNQPQPHHIGPPRKTKWEMEEEDNKKKAELYQRTAHLAPPSFVHTTYIQGHPQIAKAHVSLANRHAPQTREQMVQQGTYQEVPKNYYEGKSPPKVTLEEVQEANLEAIRVRQRKMRNRMKDPPEDVKGRNWLSGIKEKIINGSACNLNAFYSSYVIFAMISIFHLIMY